MTYEPTKSSLRARPLPDWYDDAKLGIFIHWGPQSVPGWAPTAGEYAKLLNERGWRYWFANNPYADWYQNTLKIAGSPTQTYHRQTYGADYPYDNFIPLFEDAAQRWKPEAWAEVFAQTGARYVVLTTKHHDGYLLWPSAHPNPGKRDYQSKRDLVGELTEAVRGHGMRMGLYYSGGLDWSFEGRPIQDLPDLFARIPTDPAYTAYVDAHWRELIDRYQPSVLWNDIAYPSGTDTRRLFADYYNAVPDGVVNDRFAQYNLGAEGSLRYRVMLWGVKTLAPPLIKWRGTAAAPAGAHADFRTPEYASFGQDREGQMGDLPGHRLLVLLQPGGNGRTHDRPGGTRAHVRGHREQKRQSAAERRPDGRRHDPGAPAQPPARARRLAERQRGGHFRHPAVGSGRGQRRTMARRCVSPDGATPCTRSCWGRRQREQIRLRRRVGAGQRLLSRCWAVKATSSGRKKVEPSL